MKMKTIYCSNKTIKNISSAGILNGRYAIKMRKTLRIAPTYIQTENISC